MSEVTQITRRAFIVAIGSAFGFLVVSLAALITVWHLWPATLLYSIDRLFIDFVLLRGEPIASPVGVFAIAIVKAIQTAVLFFFVYWALDRDKPNRFWFSFILFLFMLLIVPLSRIPAL